jgi:hypothetical protein
MKYTRCLIYNLHKMALTATWMIQRTNKNNIQREFLLDYLSFNMSPGVQIKNLEHLPIKKDKERRCEYCKRKSKDLKTKFYCPTCNVPLHIKNKNGDNCFLEYHS